MPCTPEAVDVLRKANILIAPAMAAGAGGVRFHFFQNMHDRDAFLECTRTMLQWNLWHTQKCALVVVVSFHLMINQINTNLSDLSFMEYSFFYLVLKKGFKVRNFYLYECGYTWEVSGV